MSIGEMFDYCITKSNMYTMQRKEDKEEKKNKVVIREATQADFDRL